MAFNYRNKMFQREYMRYNVNEEFNYSYNGKIASCEIINISERGMLLKIPQILEVGDIIKLFFKDLRNPEIRAVVKHKNYNYIGIYFLNHSQEFLEHIRKFISEIVEKNKRHNLMNIHQMNLTIAINSIL